MARGHSNHSHFSAATATATATTTTTTHSLLRTDPAHFLDVGLANAKFGGFGSGSSTSLRQNGGSSTATQLLPPPAISSLRLTTPDEATRARLQQQRVREHRRVVSDKIPGLKTSAAFFASLRTNLRLHASPPSSPMSTPPSMRGSATSLPPPSPLSWPADSANDETEPHAAEDPLADVPELQTYMARSDEDKTDALKLVADSVAQMRQTANQSLIFHPLNSALAIGIISLIARYIYDSRRDIYLVGTTCAGLLMCTLAACRMFTQNYLYAAEGINWAWLGDADMIVTKFGDEIIGTVVIDWISGESRQKRKKAWRGEIKAWTVRMKYRRKGVGSALLEDAVKEAKKKGAESIEFADDHANSKRILPKLYNSRFDKRDRKSRELLQDLLEASPTKGKRR